MQPKVYVSGSGGRLPRHAGPRRRSCAAEVGHLVPGQPAKGLPTVSGLVLLSDAETGALGTDGRGGRDGPADGGGRHDRGRDALPRGRGDDRRRSAAASTVPRRRACSGRSAATCSYGTSMLREPPSSPSSSGHRRAFAAGCARARHRGHRHTREGAALPRGSLRDGQHVSMMGADGPGRPRLQSASSRALTCSATTGSRRATAASSPPESWRGRHPRSRHRYRSRARRRRRGPAQQP